MKTEEEIKQLIENIREAFMRLDDSTSDNECFPARQIWLSQMENQIELLEWVLN